MGWLGSESRKSACFLTSGERTALINGKKGTWKWEAPPPFQLAILGYSIRTKDWRYNFWLEFDSTMMAVKWNDENAVFEEELYDHRGQENVVKESGGNWNLMEMENLAASESKAEYRVIMDDLFQIIKGEISGTEGRGDAWDEPNLYPLPNDAGQNAKIVG
jgi:hypothetical protein